MKAIFIRGDSKTFQRKVTSGDFAAFEGKVVHEVCSTFSLSRDMEWTTRLFVIEMCEPDEEGIGTFVEVVHKSPAFLDEEILFEGKIDEINGNELICSVTATVGQRLIATGRTGQKIFKREKIRQLLTRP